MIRQALRGPRSLTEAQARRRGKWGPLKLRAVFIAAVVAWQGCIGDRSGDAVALEPLIAQCVDAVLLESTEPRRLRIREGTPEEIAYDLYLSPLSAGLCDLRDTSKLSQLLASRGIRSAYGRTTLVALAVQARLREQVFSLDDALRSAREHGEWTPEREVTPVPSPTK